MRITLCHICDVMILNKLHYDISLHRVNFSSKSILVIFDRLIIKMSSCKLLHIMCNERLICKKKREICKC